MVYVIGWCQQVHMRGKKRVLGYGHWRVLSGPHRSTAIALEKGARYAGRDWALAGGNTYFVEEFRVMGRGLLPMYGCALPDQEHNLPLPGLEALK